MKYIVILIRSEMVEPEPNAPEQLEVEAQPVLCSDVAAVHEAIQEARTNSNMEWSVWEVVGSKTHRRSVLYPNDRARIMIVG